MAKLDWVRKIYEDGMHCAFTDLVRWKGHYYCCFRHAEQHAILPYGDVFIIRSGDLEQWDVCAKLTTGLDDRDPAMVVDGDRLWVYFGSRYRETDTAGEPVQNGKAYTQSHASYTTDGTSWHVPIPVYERDYWLWHPYRFEDGFYCAAYTPIADRDKRWLDFLRSDDGVTWAHVSNMASDGDCGETGLYRYEDGRILAAIRRGAKYTGTHFMEAAPPYTSWTRWSVPHDMMAPNMAKVGDVLVGAGRTCRKEPGVDYGTTKGIANTHVYMIDPDTKTTEHLMQLPSGGDTSYCGMVVLDERTLLISYYSQHEYMDRPDFQKARKPASIYLAQLSF